jgi:hypothetical protein
MTAVPDTTKTEGTISISADWQVQHGGPEPRLIITIDLADVISDIAGTDWQFDAVVDVGSETGTDITLRYIPNGGDED